MLLISIILGGIIVKNRYTADIEYLTIGLEHAAIEIEAFVNLACPYSAKFFDIADEVIKPYTEDGHVKFVIKHVDKTKNQLLRGTIANNYVDHDDPVEGFATLKKLFASQDMWARSFRETLEMCEDTLGLPEKTSAYERGVAVMEDYNARGLKIVPTVFINGNQMTDYKPAEQSAEEIKQLFTDRIESLK